MGRPKGLLPYRDGLWITHQLEAFRAAGGEDAVVVLGYHAEAYRTELPASCRIAINPHPERGQFSSLLTGLEAALVFRRCSRSRTYSVIASPEGEATFGKGTTNALERTQAKGCFALRARNDKQQRVEPDASGARQGARNDEEWTETSAAFVLPVDVPAPAPEVWRALWDARHGAWVCVPEYRGRGGHPALLSARFVEELLALPPESRLDEEIRRVDPRRVRRIPVSDPRAAMDLNTPADYAAFTAAD